MVMVFAGGHISGGYFNPAVTLGVWLRGKCEGKDVVPYMMFLFTFALAAGAFGALNPAERVSVHQSGSTDQPQRRTEAA
jgi:glycerol uptake facilitator-like aquaporin